MNQVTISVIIPAYNAEKYITEAINSVLEQDYKNLEIILVNDGSTDGTEHVINSFGNKVRLINKLHTGIADSRNIGIRSASSNLISFLDADDLWMKNKISLQLARLIDDVDIVFGHIENFISPELDKERLNLDFPRGLQAGYHPGSMLLRKSIFDKVGYFNTDLKVGEFIEWYSRVKETSVKQIMLEDLVMLRRIHDSNSSRLTEDSKQEYLRLVKERLKKQE